jgi:hypothetical protein
MTIKTAKYFSDNPIVFVNKITVSTALTSILELWMRREWMVDISCSKIEKEWLFPVTSIVRRFISLHAGQTLCRHIHLGIVVEPYLHRQTDPHL